LRERRVETRLSVEDFGLTSRSSGPDDSFTTGGQSGTMLMSDETLQQVEDAGVDGDDESGWGRLPPLESEAEEDGPVSDFRPFRDDPE
jgi:hypothetical protein